MVFRTYYNSRSISIIKKIVKAEDLDVAIRIFDDAIGDTIIEANGSKEEIAILKDVFKIIY